ncbi:terminase small subunit [Ligilactobacillus salivarius]|uniref:terminase small subunit n=1 Tax=Ligilactobacillus salivarius TaxID=1624 RepID=UPI00136CCE02|nr:terminase small subunit [Ligilactobacillus salivarius]
MKKRKLTPKQQLFADEYIKTGNATDAYIKAGYKCSRSVARRNGNRLLTNADIKSYIDAKLAEIESHKIADAKEVLQFFTCVLRGEVSETVITPDGDKVEKEPDVKTRMNAGKEIMKRYPNDSPIVKAQLRRLEAEAALKEHERKQLEEQTNSRTTIVINDEWEDDDGKDN